MMVAWGCTVWGTGWYYPPYYGFGGYYPYYYPHFPTYGYGLVQPVDRRLRTRRRGLRAVRRCRHRRPLQSAHRHLRARRSGLWPLRRARRGAGLQPAHRHYGQTRQGSNVYGSWGSTAVQRGDDWAKTNRYTNRQTGNTTRTIRTDEGAAVTRRGNNGGESGSDRAGTSTPATTATSIGGRTATGRGTTTAAGPTRRTSRPTGPGRPVARPPIVRRGPAVRPVHRIVRRPTSSIETRAPAPKARSARATPATIGRAPAAARVPAATAAVAAPAAEAGGGGGDCAAWPASRLRPAAHSPRRIIRARAGDACVRNRRGTGAEGSGDRGRTGGRERPAQPLQRRTKRHASPRSPPSRRGRRPN